MTLLSFICKLIPSRVRNMLPQDTLSLTLSTGLGFSVLAGIFSGVVYIITIGYHKAKRPTEKRVETPWHCGFCGAQFRSIDGVLEIEKVVTCVKCNRKFCAITCATRSPSATQENTAMRWICKQCQPDSWISGLIRLLQLNEPTDWRRKKMTVESAQLKAEVEELQRRERAQVRDFIERLVEALLGGELDNVSVKRIYDDERYLPIVGESPCSAHASLKNLIQRCIREASELPDLQQTENEEFPTVSIQEDTTTQDRTYEDLLSTAIINKVVQTHQEKARSQASASSSKLQTKSNEYFLGERNLDDASSASSVYDYISPNDSPAYFDQMKLAIQKSIKEVSSSSEDEQQQEEKEEVEADYGQDEVDLIDVASIRSNDWQENWYLRKRNFASGTNSPVPVPMLVPNPTHTAKVLIGDQEVEDTSDLSDAVSDYEDSAEPSSLNAVLLNSKTLIGGRNPLESLVAKAEYICDDDNITQVQVHYPADDATPLLELNSIETSPEDDIVETCNEAFIRPASELDTGACADTEEQLSLISLESNTEKDSEYTEKYATLPRKMPLPTPRQSKLSEIEFTKTCLLIEDSKTDNGDSGVTSDEDDKQKSFKSSSYGEREKDKWNHAVDLPNNPYSKSNLENRLSNRSSSVSSLNSDIHTPAVVIDSDEHIENVPPLPQSPIPDMSKAKSLFDVFNNDRQSSKHRFGADYFAKAAAKPKGALKAATWLQDDGLDGDADDEERKPSSPPEIVDEPIVPNENVFRAVPALIKDADLEDPPADDLDNSLIEFTSTPTTTKRAQPWELSSDSDYSIERTYNVNSGKIIKKLGDVEYEVLTPNEEQAEGLKYTAKEFDENQNTLSDVSIEVDRKKFLRSLTLEEEESIYMTTPNENHFKLVDDIRNETSGEYHVVPISPPAEYRTEEKEDIQQNEEIVFRTIEERKNDLNLPAEKSNKEVEYESFEKSYEFSIEDVFEEEQEESLGAFTFAPETVENTREPQKTETEENGLIENQEDGSNRKNIKDLLHGSSDDLVNLSEPDGGFVHMLQICPPKIDPEPRTEPEIDMLKVQQLVKQRLGAISKTYPNLQAGKKDEIIQSNPVEVLDDVQNFSSDLFVNDIEIKDASIEQPVPSVQCLKKRFENDSDIKKEVHSLTARSLPKHVRDELAAQTNQAVNPRRISALSETSNEELAGEDEIPIEETQLPSAKSSIAFFEQLCRK